MHDERSCLPKHCERAAPAGRRRQGAERHEQRPQRLEGYSGSVVRLQLQVLEPGVGSRESGFDIERSASSELPVGLGQELRTTKVEVRTTNANAERRTSNAPNDLHTASS